MFFRTSKSKEPERKAVDSMETVNSNYSEVLCQTIGKLRKAKGLTQEELANKLGITFQAVSKWENSASCPDVAILPLLADIFGVSVDALFGRTAPAAPDAKLPWDDDKNARAVLYIGHRLVTHQAAPTDQISKKLVYKHDGPAINVSSHFSVECGTVSGDVSAGDNVNCADVGGNVKAGDNVNCGNVSGSVDAGDGVSCANVEGSVQAGDSVSCADVTGSVKAGDNVNCKDIGADVECSGNISCGNISGNVRSGGKIRME